jgi:hypothetical protein
VYEIDKVVGAEFLVHAGVHSTGDRISPKMTAIESKPQRIKSQLRYKMNE